MAPVQRDAAGVFVRLKVQPGAQRQRIGTLVETADGPALSVAVTAPPDKGKANAAVCALLAKAWGVPKSSISVVRGQTSRRKAVHVDGEPETLEARLRAWFNARS